MQVVSATQLAQGERGTLWKAARWALWAAFLACLLLWGQYRVTRNQQFLHDRRTRAREQNELHQRSEPAALRIKELWRTQQMSRRQLERQLNQGERFALQQREGHDVAQWVDPATGQRWEFKFRDSHWAGYRTSWGTGDLERQLPSVSREGYLGTTEDMRLMALSLAPKCWIGLLILAFLLPRYRPLIAELLLAVAMLCAMAWLINPHYSLSVRGITTNDMLFWGFCMLVLSVAVLAWSTTGPFRFQYQLRTLLLIVTGYGVLFALGRLGYLLALFAPLALALYIAVRVLASQSRPHHPQAAPALSTLHSSPRD